MNDVYPRSFWGARHRDGFGARPAVRLETWGHHSVTTQLPPTATIQAECDQMRILENVGQSRFGGGISYTYAIFPSGRIYQGHSLSRVGAHTAGHNTKGIGIVFVGNYEANQLTPQQEAAAAWLLRFLDGQGVITDPRFTGGHRDVKQTSCPGRHAYARLDDISRTAGGGGGSVPAPQPAWTGAMGWPVLSYGMINDHVKALQKFLGIAQDRSFGPATLAAVQSWQTKHGLAADGYVGPATQTAMKGAGGAPAPAPSPALPTRAPKGLPPVLKVGSSGGWVSLWQGILRDCGEKVAVDGHFGPATKWATIRVQQRWGLAGDAHVGPLTWCRAMISDASGSLALGDFGPQVELWQNILGVALDRSFGPATAAATAEVQRFLGVTADGAHGPSTNAALRRHYGI